MSGCQRGQNVWVKGQSIIPYQPFMALLDYLLDSVFILDGEAVLHAKRYSCT